MPTLDLSFLLEPPDAQAVTARLVIEPLAPLSMNASVPGKHYQTALRPPERQVYGLIENAMGLHFGWHDYTIRQRLAKRAAADVSISGLRKRDFQPLVALYFDLDLVETPQVATYDDLQWAHKWRNTSQTRDGAMHHDWRAVGTDAARYGYGKTLVQREYVVAEGAWTYAVHAGPRAMQALHDALADPAAPLYLGTNDGWVHAALHEPAPSADHPTPSDDHA
jgi:hypothetical protein